MYPVASYMYILPPSLLLVTACTHTCTYACACTLSFRYVRISQCFFPQHRRTRHHCVTKRVENEISSGRLRLAQKSVCAPIVLYPGLPPHIVLQQLITLSTVAIYKLWLRRYGGHSHYCSTLVSSWKKSSWEGQASFRHMLSIVHCSYHKVHIKHPWAGNLRMQWVGAYSSAACSICPSPCQ